MCVPFGIGVEGERCGVGRGGRIEIRQKQPPFSNLYPPLTPVPQCVAEIRPVGQFPIHCHPEYFKVKLSRLTKKVLLIKGPLSLASFPPLALGPTSGSAAPLFCLHTWGVRCRNS